MKDTIPPMDNKMRKQTNPNVFIFVDSLLLVSENDISQDEASKTPELIRLI